MNGNGNTPTNGNSTPAPRFALRQVQPDMYLFEHILGEAMGEADREFHALLEPMRAADFAQADDLASAHNAAMTSIAEAAFIAGVQAGRNPWGMFLEPIEPGCAN